MGYVLRQSVDRINHYGLHIGRLSGRLSYKHPTDLNDLALEAEQIMSVQELLVSLGNAAAKVGLTLNAKKAVLMPINQDLDHQSILSRDGSAIK